MTPFLKKPPVDEGTEGEEMPSGEPTRTREPLGALLLEAGLIEQSQLDEAVREGSETGVRLGEVVVKHGWATEDDVARLLAEQAGLDYLDRASIWFDANALTRLSREDALHLEALPVRIQGDQVMVAVAEPTEERLAELRRRIGKDTVVVVVPKTALDGGIDLLESRGYLTEVPPLPDEEPEEDSSPEASWEEHNEEAHVEESPAEEPPAEEPTPEPPVAAAPPAPAEAPVNGLPAAPDLAAQARSFADSIAAQSLALQEREQQLATLEVELTTGRAALETLEAQLAASRAAMQDARAQLETVLKFLDTA